MTTSYRHSNPGASFDFGTGKVKKFTSSSIMVMHPWPAPLAWRKSKANPIWMPCRPELSIPGGKVENKINKLWGPMDSNGYPITPIQLEPWEEKRRCDTLALLYWYQLIPGNVLKELKRFSNRHWHLLSFMARCGEPALDLVKSNPALAYMLASNWVFHRPAVCQPLRSARALLKTGKKQSDIMDWLGFKGTKSTRRLLRNISPSSVAIMPLLYLRQSLENKAMLKSLSHVHSINASVLRIVTDPFLFQHVAPSFVEEISILRSEIKTPRLAYKLKDAIGIFSQLTEKNKFPLIKNTKQLKELHDTLSESMAEVFSAEKYPSFPDPPIPGNKFIEPIISPAALILEGKIQQSCVGTYIEKVLDKKCFVYKVLNPQRCTLTITQKEGIWWVSELEATANGVANQATYKAIINWLSTLPQNHAK